MTIFNLKGLQNPKTGMIMGKENKISIGQETPLRFPTSRLNARSLGIASSSISKVNVAIGMDIESLVDFDLISSTLNHMIDEYNSEHDLATGFGVRYVDVETYLKKSVQLFGTLVAWHRNVNSNEYLDPNTGTDLSAFLAHVSNTVRFKYYIDLPTGIGQPPLTEYWNASYGNKVWSDKVRRLDKVYLPTEMHQLLFTLFHYFWGSASANQVCSSYRVFYPHSSSDAVPSSYEDVDAITLDLETDIRTIQAASPMLMDFLKTKLEWDTDLGTRYDLEKRDKQGRTLFYNYSALIDIALQNSDLGTRFMTLSVPASYKAAYDEVYYTGMPILNEEKQPISVGISLGEFGLMDLMRSMKPSIWGVTYVDSDTAVGSHAVYPRDPARQTRISGTWTSVELFNLTLSVEITELGLDIPEVWSRETTDVDGASRNRILSDNFIS